MGNKNATELFVVGEVFVERLIAPIATMPWHDIKLTKTEISPQPVVTANYKHKHVL